jgi:PAP2 superfamily
MATAEGASAVPAAPAIGPNRWRGAVREILLVLAGVLVYFGVRGVTVTDAQEALRHALDVVALERSLGVYVEPSLQALVLGSDWLVDVMNWVYIWGHWPVIAVVLLWLFFAHPAGYRRTRNAMLISGGVGLVIFASFPVAPPRLAGLGLIDTVTEHSSAYRVLQPPAFVNQYAAMPSLHVGWDLLMGLAVYTYGRHIAVRIAGLALPVLMVSSVLLTANHYIIDVAVGAALVLASMAAARRIESRRSAAESDPEQTGAGIPRQRDGGPVTDGSSSRSEAS